MTTCYGYTRVSTARQGEGVSLEAQREEISRYADRHAITISHWFEERETAAKSGRPVFNRVVRDLLQNKADGLIVHKIDRSARNFRDWAQIGELADKGIAIHFASESLDFQSRGGRLTADIQAVIASDYIRNLREEAIKGLKGRLKQGLYPFRAPLGYLNQGRGKPKVLDPARAPLVREIFEIYAAGTHGIRSLAAEMARRGLRNLGGRPVSFHGIEKILSNPFYCGIIRIARTGETYDGVHEPLISSALFSRVQDMKAGKYGKKTTRHMHTYRGLFKCHYCALAMIAERQKGHVYYRCHRPDCPTKGVREEVIEGHVRALLQKTCVTPRQSKALRRAIEDWWQDRQAHQETHSALRLQAGKLEARQDALTDALIDGLVDKEVYHRKREALMLELGAIRDSLTREPDFDAERRHLGKFLELLNTLAPLYDLVAPAEKRLIVQSATSNRTVAGKTVYLEPSNWLEAAHSAETVSDGAPCRPTSRTGREVHKQRLEALRTELTAPDVPKALEDLMALFDRHLGGARSAPEKARPERVGPGVAAGPAGPLPVGRAAGAGR